LRTGALPPGGPIPQLTLAPQTLNFHFTPGNAAPAPQTVGLTSSPGLLTGLVVGTVLYAPISSGWLTADLAPGSTATPASLVVTVTPPSDLEPGTYVAHVPVGSTVGGVLPQDVVATLTVDSVPKIVLSPGNVSIAVAQGGPNPAPQFVDVDNGGSGVLSGLAVGAVSYGPGATGWLGASLNPAVAPATLTVQATSTGLAIGTYTARVPISSTLAGVAPETLTVSLGVSTLATPPSVVVSPHTIAVSATAGGANPPAQVVAVSNGGGGTLSGLATSGISYLTAPGGWLTVSMTQTTAPANVTVQATTGTLPAGTHTARVPVTSSLPGAKPDTFFVNFTVAAAPVPPAIGLAPNTVTFTANAGGVSPGAVTAQVTNAGGGSLALLSLGSITYGIGASGWLNASLSNTTAPATITLTPTLGALGIGTYTATVPVQSGVVGVVPVNLAVTFQVVGPPVPPSIGYSPTSVSFNAQGGGANPAAKTITITNAGGSTLTGLALGSVAYGSGQPLGWLGAVMAGTTAPTTITLSPTTGTLAPGTYTATVPITSAVANNSPRTVSVSFTVTAPPSMVLAPSTVPFTGTTGQPNPTPATVSITNGGAGTLTGLAASAVSYGAGQPTGWLTRSLSGTSSPATLVLTAATGSLPAGSYSATTTVSTATPGVAAKTVTVTFQVAAPAGGLVILQGNNQSGLVGTTLPAALRAQVLDASSNPKAGTLVNWQVNNGGTLLNVISTSDAQGIVSANWKVGPLAGIHTVTVSSAGLPTQTFQADVLLPTNPNAHPNEPPGFTAFAEHNLSSFPAQTRGLGGLLGAWYAIGSTNLGVVTPDLTAPASPPNVLSVRFPKGLVAGTGPVNFGGWDVAGKTAGQKSKLYFSMWLKCVGTDYENQSVGTKMGFFGGAVATSATAHNSWFFLKGIGTQTIAPNYKVELHQSNPNPINLPQNVSTQQLMACGVWHHWEAILQLNGLGQSDGKFQWWIDGTLVMDRPDLVYIYPGATNRFYDYVFNPTWGGTGGSKTRDDFWRIDHIYMSGVP